MIQKLGHAQISVECLLSMTLHKGFGSDADSLRNCFALVPRPPKHDFRHWEANDGKTLRFTAQFLPGAPNVVPPNDERRFVVTLYMVDNTVSVYGRGLHSSTSHLNLSRFIIETNQ
jgi:hypothetical protein